MLQKLANERKQNNAQMNLTFQLKKKENRLLDVKLN